MKVLRDLQESKASLVVGWEFGVVVPALFRVCEFVVLLYIFRFDSSSVIFFAVAITSRSCETVRVICKAFSVLVISRVFFRMLFNMS